MTSEQLKELLQRYLTGQATDEDLEFIGKWFAHTEQRDYALDTQKRAEVAARLLPRLHAITWPEQAEREFPDTLTATTEAPAAQTGLFILSRRMLRIAAVFIVVLASAAILYSIRYKLLDRIDPIPMKTIIAGNYEIRSVVLPDSSRAILKNGSRISFPEHYRGRERNVTMEGAVYFDVHKDADRPFNVHSAQMDIKVLGTSFVIQETAKTTTTTVDVVSGRIAVAHENEDLGELGAGSGLTYDKKTGTASRQAVDTTQALAWIHKTFSFDETPLESVFAAMQNKFGVKFVIQKHSPDNIKLFTGMFSDTDSLKDILLALSLSTGIRYSTIGKHAIEIHYP